MIKLHVIYILHIYFTFKDTYRLKVKKQKKMQHAKSNQKRTEMPILISEKKTLTKIVTRDKESYHFMINGSTSRRYNNHNLLCTEQQSSKYIKQKWTEMKREAENLTIIIGDFNTPLSVIELSRRYIRKYTTNNSINQIETVDIYRTLHHPTTECTFFSSVHGIFSKLDHVRL